MVKLEQTINCKNRNREIIMTSSYLFNSEGLVALARYVAPDTLFAFDLDGTLAPIVDDYAAVEISDPVRIALERLVKLAKVVVITDRSRQDAIPILGVEPQLLIGNHGAEWPLHAKGRNWQHVGICLDWRDRLFGMIYDIPDVEIEFKGESLSLHYRNSIDREYALARIDAAINELTPSPKRICGKYVVNILPIDALTKGEALAVAMEKFGVTRAIYFGDDITDEEVFKLTNVDLFGVHIGKDDETAASYYLNKQIELLGLINSMIGMLEAHTDEEL